MTPTAKTIEKLIDKLNWRNDCTNEAGYHHAVCQGCEEIVVLNKEDVHSLIQQTGNELIGEDIDETYQKACFDNGRYLKTVKNMKAKYQNQLREEQRRKLSQLLTALKGKI